MFRWILLGLFSVIYAQPQQTLPVVSIAEVKKEAFHPVLSVPGNVVANNGANLALESSGVITNIYVVSGQMVKKGDLLLVLDNSSQKASYDAAVTSAKYAEIEFNRQKGLFEEGVVSAETYESAETKLAEALSALVSAEVALNHRSLYAPFDGQIGVIQLSVGQYVGVGTELLSLFDLNEMRVEFSISQEMYDQVTTGLALNIKNPIEDKLGKVSATSPLVDSSSGQVPVQGVFDNKGVSLPSGLLVEVDINLASVPEQLLVPASAVSYSLSGDYVYVVEDIKTSAGKTTGKVSQVIVTLGRIGNNTTIVKTGLKAGQKVISAGVNKLSGSGTMVEIDSETPLPS